MGRIRTIKPELFMDEELGTLSGDHLALFTGLLTLADREGRLEDRPVRIKAALFPYRTVDVSVLLDDLERIGKVSRYDVGGGHFVVIWGFAKHQRCHPKEPQSTLPPPPRRDPPLPITAGNSCIPSSPVGREGKGREGDLGREPRAGPSVVGAGGDVFFGTPPTPEPNPSAPPITTQRATEPAFKHPEYDAKAIAEEEFAAANEGAELDWGTVPNGPEERALRALAATRSAEQLRALLRTAFDPTYPRYGSLASVNRPGAYNEIRSKATALKGSARRNVIVAPPREGPPCALCGDPFETRVWEQPLCARHSAEAVETDPRSAADVAAWIQRRREAA